MNRFLRNLMSQIYRAPAGDNDGGAAGAAEDRGDSLDAGAPANVDDIVDPLADEVVEDGGTEGEAADPAAKDEKPKKDSRIPLARHKAMMDQGRTERDALVAELAKYKQGAQVVASNEQIEATETRLVALETEYNQLLADGEIAKATAKMTEIRRTERTVSDQKSDIKAEAAEVRAVERVRYNTVVERLEAAFPALNPDADEFDKESMAEVLDLQKSFVNSGATPTDALQRAVKYVMGAETAKEKSATSVTPNVAKSDVVAMRKQEALARNIAAAKATPANTAKVGLNGDEAGGALTGERAMKMSQDDFAKLDEKALAQLRGDAL